MPNGTEASVHSMADIAVKMTRRTGLARHSSARGINGETERRRSANLSGGCSRASRLRPHQDQSAERAARVELEGRVHGRSRRGCGMSRRARKPTMNAKATADYAMSTKRLDHWLRDRAIAASADSTPIERSAASSLSMLDGFVTAIVVGPVSASPPEWICSLLGVTPDAFNHNDEFAAIATTAIRFNLIGEALVQAHGRYEPPLTHADGVVDARPWCEGFYAAMKLRLLAWSLLMAQHSIEHGLLLPILFYCRDDKGRPLLLSTTPALAHEAWRDIRAVVPALRHFWKPSRYPRGA